MARCKAWGGSVTGNTEPITNVQIVAIDIRIGILESGDGDPSFGSDVRAGIFGSDNMGVSRGPVVARGLDAGTHDRCRDESNDDEGTREHV